MVKKAYADLHNHTTASDGTYTPSELVYHAKMEGLHAIGVTDHDTTDGLEEAIIAGKEHDLEIVPGIEINTQMDNREIHILGYFIDYSLPWFQDILMDIKNIRYSRAEKMIYNLNRLHGMKLNFKDILDKAGGRDNVGRPHIARAMIDKGIVDNIPEAFEKYIGEGCSAYVGRYKLSAEEGIKIIKDARGAPVLAHPGLIGNDSMIEKLIPLGLMGIEAYHSKHSDHQSEHYACIGKSKGLIVTGGSDCHGDEFPNVGHIRIDYNIVGKLKEIAK